MKRFETKKLFYNEFKYKFVFKNELGSVFSNKNLAYAREVIDRLQGQLDRGEDLTFFRESRSSILRSVDVPTMLENKVLLRFLINAPSSYRIRHELSNMAIFSNNKEWLKEISRNVQTAREFWEPPVGHEYLLEDPNVEIVSRPTDYPIKVYLKSGWIANSELASWIENNPKLAKATPLTLKRLRNGFYFSGHYFCIRDEKVLTMLALFPVQTGRIDKLVYIDDEDK